jgi:hypothetical protein
LVKVFQVQSSHYQIKKTGVPATSTPEFFQKGENAVQERLLLLIRMNPAPTSPRPRRTIVEGSGTAVP